MFYKSLLLLYHSILLYNHDISKDVIYLMHVLILSFLDLLLTYTIGLMIENQENNLNY